MQAHHPLTIRNLTIISLLGVTAVIFGAFGSHILKTKLSPEFYIAWHTGIEYQFYHLMAIFFCSLLPKKEKWFQRPEFWFLLGILFFSGSLYILSLWSILIKTMQVDLSPQPLPILFRFLGIFTPVGGLCFILGWLILLYQKAINVR